MRKFRYLKADVEWEVRINATPFHVGALCISYLPCVDPLAPLNDLNARHAIQRTGNNATLLTASSTQAASGVIPMLYPAYMDMGIGSTTISGRIGTLFIDVLAPLSSSSAGTVTPVSVSVFASFKNTELAGYNTLDIETFDTSYRRPIHEEAREKATKGLLTTMSEAVSDITPMFKSIPFLGEGAGMVEMVNNLLKPAFGALGLSKPLTVAATQPVITRQFSDLPSGRGVDYGICHGLDPEASLHALKKNFNVDTIQEYIGRPMLLTIFALSDPERNTILANIPVNPSHFATYALNGRLDSYAGFMARFFRYWRGGMKYRFVFVCSKFTTARFRIMHLPMADAAADPEATAGDVPSAIVDVRGDTIFDFTAPHLARTEYLSTDPVTGNTYSDLTCNGTIQLSLVNNAVNSDVAVPALIWVLVFSAAAEDLEFSQYRGCYMPDNYLWDTSLVAAFKSPFKGLIPVVAQPRKGTSTSETYESLTSLFKRYGHAGDMTSVPTAIDYGAVTLTAGNFELLNLRAFLKTIRAYRGGIRYKALNSNINGKLVPAIFISGAGNLDDTSNGTVWGNGFAIEGTVPYFGQVPYNLTLRNVGVLDFEDSSSIVLSSIAATFIAVAEDFQFLYAAAPPFLTYQAPALEDIEEIPIYFGEKKKIIGPGGEIYLAPRTPEAAPLPSKRDQIVRPRPYIEV